MNTQAPPGQERGNPRAVLATYLRYKEMYIDFPDHFISIKADGEFLAFTPTWQEAIGIVYPKIGYVEFFLRRVRDDDSLIQ